MLQTWHGILRWRKPVSKPIRLLAVDLDFTLLDSNREIPEANRRAVRRAWEAGITVVLASGRIASGMARFADHLKLSTPLVSCNGALVIDGNGQTVVERTCHPEVSRRILDYCRAHDHHVHLYAEGAIWFAEPDAYAGTYLSRARQPDHRFVGWEALYSFEPIKLVVMGEPEEVARARSGLSETVGPDRSSVTVSEAEYLEFLPAECSKATGLGALAERLGIARDEVAAIGDYENDLEMVRWAGFGAAVGNALPEVQAAADVVVGTNDEGGVAQFIDLLLENRGQSQVV